MAKYEFLLGFMLLFYSINTNGQPKDWYHLTNKDGYNGIGTFQTYKEIIKNNPGQTVIVAVIDSGIDIEHEDLKENIWINLGEVPNNGIDDDKNGYVDDINGWNFIGGKDGQNVGADTYEATRVYGKLKYKYDNANESKLTKEQMKEYEIYKKVKENVENERKNAESRLAQYMSTQNQLIDYLNKLDKKMDELNISSLDSLSKLDVSGDQALTTALRIVGQVKSRNISINTIEEVKAKVIESISKDKKSIEDKLNISYNPDFDPRKDIVKDNYADSYEKYYGNNDVEGPDALHGTHVAGIIGAVSNNEIGNDGIARNIKIMSVRAVPDGDERDKDVANAIRYAVDNGANVINMSFGKGYSWDKEVVNEAVKYAAKKDVLLVHAAGNSAMDNDSNDNFPNDNIGKSGFLCKKEKKAKNWIEVGALSYDVGENMVAGFSNYGSNNVDVFAPGVQIYNTLPDNNYANLQGTSMASPVVAGIACVLRSQYPRLTAEQVKEAIEKSVVKNTTKVKKPGKSSELVPFSELSTSGGYVDLFQALKYAAKLKGKKNIAKKNTSA
jgi:subtilisin family serine protease